MGSIDRLALGSVICGGGGVAIVCLALFSPTFYETELSVAIAGLLFVIILLAPLFAVALGLAALKRPGVRSGEGPWHTAITINLAWFGIALGLLHGLLYCLAMVTSSGS